MFRANYYDNTYPLTEKSYKITDIFDRSNSLFSGCIEIRFDNTDFIEHRYLNKYRFLYKDEKLYINVGEFTAKQGYSVIASQHIENTEHLWNILKSIKDNPEVIKLVTKIISCLS